MGFRLSMPFWIDTDAYTDRDRAMFVAGCEFCDIVGILEGNDYCETVIHRENESRVRLAAGQLGRRITITACKPEHDPNGTWSYLTIEAR